MNSLNNSDEAVPALGIVHAEPESQQILTLLPEQYIGSALPDLPSSTTDEDFEGASLQLSILTIKGRDAPAVRPLSCGLDGLELGADEYILISALQPRQIMLSAEQCFRNRLPAAIDVQNFPILDRAIGRRVGSLPVVLIRGTSPSRWQAWALRARDILLAGAALVLLLPLFLVIGLLIVCTSSGPVFYRTEVVGKDGRPFRWRKFRSMHLKQAEESIALRRAQYLAFMRNGIGTVPNSTSKKVIDLQRVTKVGAILRRHSIDELPQLWDVLVGNMTLVGPRPALPYEHEIFEDWQRLRVAGITPGLTGPWQAYGRSSVPFDEMVLMDYCYGRGRSLWLDIRIMLRTVWVMVTGEGGV